MQTQISVPTATKEVTVNLATGEAFISQRKLAAELGIHHSSLQTHLATRHPNLLFSEGIPSSILQETATYFAYKSKAANATAEAFVTKLMEAGAKAYLYHEAGLSIGITQQRPLTQLEAYEELVRMEKTRLALLDTVGAQEKVINHKNIKTDSSSTHFTIKRIRTLNQGMKIDPKILLKVCETLGNGVETVYDHYDQSINQYSREVWEEAYPDAELP